MKVPHVTRTAAAAGLVSKGPRPTGYEDNEMVVVLTQADTTGMQRSTGTCTGDVRCASIRA